MTELEFVTELKKQPDFSMNSVCRLVDKTRLKKEYLGVLRRNMMNKGLVSRFDYKFTDKLDEWFYENEAKADVKLTSDSFREKDVAAMEKAKYNPNSAKAEAKKVMHEQASELMAKAKAELMAAEPQPQPLPIPAPVAYNNRTSHQDLLASLHELYVAKNQDYGDSFHINFTEFGIMSALIRMNDKWNRIKSLSKQPALVADESLRDTLIALANYSLMTVMELDRGGNG